MPLGSLKKLNLVLLVANLAKKKMMQKNFKKWLKPWHAVLIWECSARAIQWIPPWKGLVFFKNIYNLVLWTNVASALEGGLTTSPGVCAFYFCKVLQRVLVKTVHRRRPLAAEVLSVHVQGSKLARAGSPGLPRFLLQLLNKYYFKYSFDDAI